MQDNMNKDLAPDEEEVIVYTLTDEDTGEECDYELLAEAQIDGQLYYALFPLDDEGSEYVILKAREEGEDILFETIDDDDEFEKMEEYFNDLLFDEVDYDKK